MSTTQTQTRMLFMTTAEFKSKLGVSEIQIVKNPNTGKLFASTNAGNYKVQGVIDSKKPIRFMYEDGKFSEGCITNVSDSDNVKFTL